jgi:hypothetical protein
MRVFHLVNMRIAIITESFAPDLNGVAHTVLRVAEHLTRRGHEPLIIAPEPPPGRTAGPFPYPVERVPSIALPGYPSFRLGLPSRAIRSALVSHGTELVHLASPVFLGVTGQTLQEAAASGLPVVAPAAGGPLDLIDDGVTGYLVTPGSAEALAGPVASLAADAGLRAAQGQAARQKVLSRSWSAIGDKLIDHYAAILQPGLSPGLAGAAA